MNWRIPALCAGALLAVACAQPRIVRTSTGTKDQIKFLTSDGSTQTVVQCQRAENGTLQSCRELPVVLND
jgi:hypothetical protein